MLGEHPYCDVTLSVFISHMATVYSGKTILNYLSGVRAWHILHRMPWALERRKMDLMLQAADKLMLDSSRRKKRCPYTPGFMAEIGRQLDLRVPLDAAIFACLTTCFYALARLGEFTVRTLTSFNPNVHVTTQNLTYEQDRHGYQVTVLHLPSTKSTSAKGKDMYWASQQGDTDPKAALQNHLQVNQPTEALHLFAYQAKHMRCPLTKMKFLERIGAATCAAGLETLQGHGIRIRSMLEYLLRGVPFDVMKAKGQWAGNAFQLYLRKHTIVIAPYIQAEPAVHEAVVTNQGIGL